MSMDLFRRKQKVIMWIVTLIIVPSFVLVWGVSGSYDGAGGREVEVGRIDDKNIGYHEFDAFRKRLLAAVGGVPIQVVGAPGAGTEVEEYWKYIYAYALLMDAEKSGNRASDLQVGTYIRSTVVSGSDAQKDSQAVEKAVDAICRQMQISRQEYMRGVREWQTIGNYIVADSILAPVNEDTVFDIYRFNRAECVVKRVRVLETADIQEQAKKDVIEKPADELERNIRTYAESKKDDFRYRDPAAWRFAYVLTPFVSESSVRQPTDAEIQDAYLAGVSTTYNNMPLEEVRDRVKADLLRQEVERQTIRNFTVDVDPQLRGQGKDMALDELVKLTQLAKYGVATGDSGEEVLPIDTLLEKLPAGLGFELRLLLDAVDRQPAENREAMLADWKDGFNLLGRPFKADQGFVRLRLLDYRPSTAMNVDNEDGSLKEEVKEMALVDMVSDRAAELVDEKAQDTESRIRGILEAREKKQDVPEAELAAEFDSLPEETITYNDLYRDNALALVRLVVGDMVGPLAYVDPATGAKGKELVVLVGRRLPSREAYDAESADVKRSFRQIAFSNIRGNYGVNYTMNGPVAVIQPSPSLLASLFNRSVRSQIVLNAALFNNAGNEG